MARVLIVYHSYNQGPVSRLARGIAEGAREVRGTDVVVKSVEQVSEPDILAADGIAIGSPKCVGHTISPEIFQLLNKMASVREKLAYKVGTAFSGSHGSFGGQEIVCHSLFHAMLLSNMVIVGNSQPADNFSDFVGGVIVEELDEKTGHWARTLGKRLAQVADRLSSVKQ